MDRSSYRSKHSHLLVIIRLRRIYRSLEGEIQVRDLNFSLEKVARDAKERNEGEEKMVSVYLRSVNTRCSTRSKMEVT